jgi:hypothetical protein
MGGILVARCASICSASNIATCQFSSSAKMEHVSRGSDWWLTSIYGPSHDQDKPQFLDKLHELGLIHSGPWFLNGDSNMIYKAEDKNNGMLNH